MPQGWQTKLKSFSPNWMSCKTIHPRNSSWGERVILKDRPEDTWGYLFKALFVLKQMRMYSWNEWGWIHQMFEDLLRDPDFQSEINTLWPVKKKVFPKEGGLKILTLRKYIHKEPSSLKTERKQPWLKQPVNAGAHLRIWHFLFWWTA